MAYPSDFLTRTALARVRLRHTGGSVSNNINTQLNLFIDLLRGATEKDVKIQGNFAAKDILPYANTTYDLGSSTYNFISGYLDNGATDGGTLYFNAGGSNLHSNAAGTVLTANTFTSLNLAGDVQVAGGVGGYHSFYINQAQSTTSTIATITVTDATYNGVGHIMVSVGGLPSGAARDSCMVSGAIYNNSVTNDTIHAATNFSVAIVAQGGGVYTVDLTTGSWAGANPFLGTMIVHAASKGTLVIS